eukprot:2144465-Rhodomonas_salina.2
MMHLNHWPLGIPRGAGKPCFLASHSMHHDHDHHHDHHRHHDHDHDHDRRERGYQKHQLQLQHMPAPHPTPHTASTFFSLRHTHSSPTRKPKTEPRYPPCPRTYRSSPRSLVAPYAASVQDTA